MQQRVLGSGKLASQKNAAPGQMALTWLLSKSNDIVPIPGSKRLSYLEENIAATQITLSAQEIAQLEATVGPVAGARYTQDRLRQISRDWILTRNRQRQMEQPITAVSMFLKEIEMSSSLTGEPR
jgi:Aldo/keto reductase family